MCKLQKAQLIWGLSQHPFESAPDEARLLAQKWALCNQAVKPCSPAHNAISAHHFALQRKKSRGGTLFDTSFCSHYPRGQVLNRQSLYVLGILSAANPKFLSFFASYLLRITRSFQCRASGEDSLEASSCGYQSDYFPRPIHNTRFAPCSKGEKIISSANSSSKHSQAC